MLEEFKNWADWEFGGVRAAFEALDEDKSGDFSQREFLKMLRSYGFQGDCKALFATLSGGAQDSVSLQDIAFLDLWDEDEDDGEEDGPAEKKPAEVAPKRPPKLSPRLAELAKTKKSRLPLLTDTSKTTLASGWTTSTSLSKPQLLKSVYGSLPGLKGLSTGRPDFGATAFLFHELPRTTLRKMRVQAIKDEILLDDEISEQVQELPAKLVSELLSIKKRTLALRHRTVELFGKSDDSEAQDVPEVTFKEAEDVAPDTKEQDSEQPFQIVIMDHEMDSVGA